MAKRGLSRAARGRPKLGRGGGRIITIRVPPTGGSTELLLLSLSGGFDVMGSFLCLFLRLRMLSRKRCLDRMERSLFSKSSDS